MRTRFLRLLSTVVVVAALLGIPISTASALAGSVTLLSPASGPPGTLVYVTAAGFTPDRTYTVLFNGVSTGYSGSTGASGNFTAPFYVPTGYQTGNYAVTIYTPNDSSTTMFFQVTATLVSSAASGYGGDQITLTASGFTASSTVTVYFDSTLVLTTQANTLGQINVSMTVPKVQWGPHTIRATDIYGSSLSTTYTILQKMTVTPTDAAVGAALSIVGTGFGASQTLTIYFDESTVATTSTDSVGAFTHTSLTMPASVGGTHTFKAQDGLGNTYSVTVNIIQTLTVSPASGPVGTRLTVAGSGFRPNDYVNLSLDGTAIGTPISTGTTGVISTTVDVPATGAGVHNLTAADSLSTLTKTFTVTSTATAAPTSGFVGTKVTVSGTGFLAGTNINILFDGATAKTLTSDAQGSFATTFDAPSKAAGTYKIRATDGANFKDIDFAITTSASINPVTSATSPGNVGSDITVSGVGFKPSSTLTVTYDGKSVTTGTVAADSNFTITFKAPASKAGQHTITVSDGLSNIPVTFFVESTPPPAPTLVEPAAGAKQKDKAAFTWNAVSDPSGVVYTFQISKDAGFSSGSIILEKTGLTTAQYTLTEAEKLEPSKKDLPYFWRVMATDSASNAGPWSNVRSFSVGTAFPAWAIWTLVGLGAVIILLFAFWLGRRTTSKSSSARLNDEGELK